MNKNREFVILWILPLLQTTERLGFCQRTKKIEEHEGDGDANCSWCTWNGPQELGEGSGEIENQWKNQDPLDSSIANVGQNTEKNPGDLRRLAITQILVKYH